MSMGISGVAMVRVMHLHLLASARGMDARCHLSNSAPGMRLRPSCRTRLANIHMETEMQWRRRVSERRGEPAPPASEPGSTLSIEYDAGASFDGTRQSVRRAQKAERYRRAGAAVTGGGSPLSGGLQPMINDGNPYQRAIDSLERCVTSGASLTPEEVQQAIDDACAAGISSGAGPLRRAVALLEHLKANSPAPIGKDEATDDELESTLDALFTAGYAEPELELQPPTTTTTGPS